MKAALLVILLAGCTSVAVRDSGPEPPPIPAELFTPCETPAPLTDGSMAGVYQQMLRDAAREWRCIGKHGQLAALVKYRDEFVAKLRADKPAKAWFEFWK